MNPDEIVDVEIHLLIEAVHRVYGYDFRDYSAASLRRRLVLWLSASEFGTFSQAQEKVIRDPAAFDSLLRGITVNVTEMFRDASFFLTLREQVIPFLKTYPFVKIWHAGCATGEEVYSMAILLHEAGMQGRYRIYATDINEAVLEAASEAIFPLADMQGFTQNYQKSGGKLPFSDYYTARYDRAILMPELKRDIVFTPHNLAVDADFGEMHLILCRNVMIYFKPVLKERCLGLFDDCLLPGGFLCLGVKETLDQKKIGSRYKEVVPRMRIYQKKYDA